MKIITKFICLAFGAALIATASPALAQNKPVAEQSKPDAKVKPYPLDKCIVTDEKLGEMGKPYVFVHEGQEIKLCCKSCLKRFNKEPQKYLKKIADAEKAAKK